MKKMICLILLAALLGGCSSLPLPNGPKDSLLLIPADITAIIGDEKRPILSVTLELNANESGEIYKVKASASDDFFAISLPPGRYSCYKANILIGSNDGDPYLDSRSFSPITVYLERNVVFVTTKMIELISTDWYHLYSSGIFDFGDDRKRIDQGFENLMKEFEWTAWENAQIVGLE